MNDPWRDIDEFTGEEAERLLELTRGLSGDYCGPITDAEKDDMRLRHAVELALNRAGLGATYKLVEPLVGYFSAPKDNRPTLAALAASLRLDVVTTREIVDAIDRFRGL